MCPLLVAIYEISPLNGKMQLEFGGPAKSVKPSRNNHKYGIACRVCHTLRGGWRLDHGYPMKVITWWANARM